MTAGRAKLAPNAQPIIFLRYRLGDYTLPINADQEPELAFTKANRQIDATRCFPLHYSSGLLGSLLLLIEDQTNRAKSQFTPIAVTKRTTGFSMVRFANVLGSSGSIVPLFRKQIAGAGHGHQPQSHPVLHTIPEAAQLAIWDGPIGRFCPQYGRSGEVR